MKAKNEIELSKFKRWGDSLEKYANEIGRTIIIEGLSEEEEKSARKKILKVAESLKKGKGKYIDEEMYELYESYGGERY